MIATPTLESVQSLKLDGFRIAYRPSVRSDLWVIEGILFGGEYDRLQLRPDDVVLDVGANIGIFTLVASRRAKLVISVEPQPENYSLLVRNIERNQQKNIRAFNAAASSARGTVRLEGTGSMARISTQGLQVAALTLDELLERNGLPPPTVLKVDVEGHELEVLGGFSRLSGVREVIVETHSRDLRTEVSGRLETAGFAVHDVSFTNIPRIASNLLVHAPSFANAEIHNRFATVRMMARYLAGSGPNPVGPADPSSGTSILYGTKSGRAQS